MLINNNSFGSQINKQMDKRPQQHIDDSYDQAKLSTLKKQIALPKSQLFELVNDDDKLTEKLKNFNKEGCKCIDRQEFYEAIVFLNEAEVTLEYAANCGKTIERSLIISTLHNQACVYQRMWQLDKSADYLEAIIYNITSFLQGEERYSLCQQILDDKSVQSQKLAVVLQNKIKLISYYLQFCAVSSQLKRHENSLNAASKSLDILKEICEELHQYQNFIGMKYHTELEKNMLLELRNIKDFKEQAYDIDQNVERFMNKAKKSIGMFQKKIKFSYNLLDSKQKQQLQEFSIGSVMQVYPQLLAEKIDRKWLKQELTPLSKIFKALYISITHFTMATELRLIANNRYGAQNTDKRGSTQFKSSQLHHLIAVITVALYVPYETIYLQHILNSYKNHYQIDLTQISESTLSEELSNTLEHDDEIHLEISSLYRKKHKQDGNGQNQNYKSSVKLTEANLHSVSPSLHNQLKRSKPKMKSSQQIKDHNSIKQKFKMISDSQRQRKQSKSRQQGKSVNKKSKSKKKGQSRTKEGLQSPLSVKKSQHQTESVKPPIPTSRSKSKNKKKSVSKPTSEYSNQKKIANTVRSEHEYGFKGTNTISRTTKGEKDKKSLRTSERKSEVKKNDLGATNNEIRFIRQGKSPSNIPKSTK